MKLLVGFAQKPVNISKMMDQLRCEPDQLSIKYSRYLNAIKKRRFMHILYKMIIIIIFTMTNGILLGVHLSFPSQWIFSILMSIFIEIMTLA